MSEGIMNIDGIMKRLPQRYPFLMLDRVVECEPGKTLTAIKNVSINEPFFQGHFPGLPLMPGVLILEALAQATGVLAFCTLESMPANKKFLFVGIDKARFKRQVVPGDQLILKVEYIRHKRGVWVFNAVASVGDEIAASAELMCAEREM
ncbi:MAG: 3-hydroxyacyl-ACP dehydratase FabZ [Pseudomonadota bacterium]|nr:3-hydroxyacyl-ACP dehydratase FabZ [Pseudomonadota bacterium]